MWPVSYTHLVLIPQEVEELIQRLRGLKAMGKTIILITHKLNEVKMCADNISVIRAGRLIGTIKNDEEATKEKLSQMMVGRPVILNIEKGPRKVEKEVLLSVEEMCIRDRSIFKLLIIILYCLLSFSVQND